MNRRAPQQHGVSLMELLTVVVIVGILAAIMLPGFRRSVERRYWRQARDLLYATYAGERVYFFANGEYLNVPLGAGAATWNKIHMDLPSMTSIPVTFQVTSVATSFTAKANRLGQEMSINQDHTLCLGPPMTPCGTWPMP